MSRVKQVEEKGEGKAPDDRPQNLSSSLPYHHLGVRAGKKCRTHNHRKRRKQRRQDRQRMGEGKIEGD